MTSDIHIIKANYKDVPKIFEIIENSQKLISDPSWFCADNEEFLTRHIENEGFILKAVNDNVIAGYLIVRYPKAEKDNLGVYLELNPKEIMKVAHIESIAVAPDFLGLGIQKSLIESAETHLKNTDICYYMATVHPENIYSFQNFNKLGYTIVTTTIKYGGLLRHVLCKRREKVCVNVEKIEPY